MAENFQSSKRVRQAWREKKLFFISFFLSASINRSIWVGSDYFLHLLFIFSPSNHFFHSARSICIKQRSTGVASDYQIEPGAPLCTFISISKHKWRKKLTTDEKFIQAMATIAARLKVNKHSVSQNMQWAESFACWSLSTECQQPGRTICCSRIKTQKFFLHFFDRRRQDTDLAENVTRYWRRT